MVRNSPIKLNFLTEFNPEYLAGGHSGGVTPGLVPNPEVKPASDPSSTLVRELRGNSGRCQPFFTKQLIFPLSDLDWAPVV